MNRHTSFSLSIGGLLVAALMFVGLLGLVGAQSGGGYDLSWSTVDGGGHTWSTGNGYSMGGAIGQADAQFPATGSGYSLQGGFWHGHCAPMAVQVDITCEGTQAHLEWTPDAANMAYDIYRNTGPYLAPDPTSKVDTDSDGIWLDPLTGTCGDVASNYFYQVRAPSSARMPTPTTAPSSILDLCREAAD